MAIEPIIIRPSELPVRTNPVPSEVVPSDNNVTVAGVSWEDGVGAAVPPASQPEAEAGVINSKRMTPLTTKQAIDAQVGAKLAAYTPTSGLADVATSGDYDDLIGKPTLGTAAAADATDFATAAQGGLADTSIQPGDVGSGSDLSVDGGKLALRGDVKGYADELNLLRVDGSTVPVPLQDALLGGEVQADWFRWSTDGTDDALAVQRAIDYLEKLSDSGATSRGGIIRLGRKAYNWETIPETTEPGILIVGQGVGNTSNIYMDVTPYFDDAPTTVWIDHDEGEGIRFKNQGSGVMNFRLAGVQSRWDAAYDADAPAILFKPVDAVNGTVKGAICIGMRIDRHPGAAVKVVGNSLYHRFDHNTIFACKGHGVDVQSGAGDLVDAAHYPGLGTIDSNLIGYIGGNGIHYSDPTATNGGQGFRVRAFNNDIFATCGEASAYTVAASVYFKGENIVIDGNGLSGQTDNPWTDDAVEGAHVSGKNIIIRGNRFINCSQPIAWDGAYTPGNNSNGLVVEYNLVTQASLTVAVFVKVLNPTLAKGLVIRHGPQKTVAGPAFTGWHTAGVAYPLVEWRGTVTSAGGTKTIAAGVLTIDALEHEIAGEGSAADDLDSIVDADGAIPLRGAVVTVYNNQGYTITARHAGGGGNVRTKTAASVAIPSGSGPWQFKSDGFRMWLMD